MSRKRLYLIDGMSHIYRAYYAIRSLSNSKGLPTNAVFGFTTMLRKLIQDQKPDYLAVAIDLEGPTVRHEQYEGYKATRKPMPEELVEQLPWIRKVCEVFRVPVIGFPGYEADDVIGTLADKAVAQGLTAVVATSDKDMLQLVSEHVLVLDPRKEDRLVDAHWVVEKLGVNPEQVPDLLGLWGDSSDNIPGAPGIGEKGARELLQSFGTLEGCLENWRSVKKKVYQESLRDNAELIRTSRELATIRRDLPIDLDLDALRLSEPDRPAALQLFAELEFNSLKREFLVEQHTGTELAEWLPTSAAIEFLRSLRNQQRIYLALSFQDGPGARKTAATACVQGETGHAALLDLGDERIAEAWKELSQASPVPAACWDAKLYRLAMREVAGVPRGRVDDVMLMAFLVSPHLGDYSLRRWALDLLHVSLPESVGRNGGLLSHPKEAEGTGLSAALNAVRGLFGVLSAMLDEQQLREVYERIELPLVPVLAEMERAGVRVDRKMLEEMSRRMEMELTQLTSKIYAAAGTEFNINSTKQLGEILFERLNLPSGKKTRKTKGYSTDQTVLEELAVSYELPRLILDYRQITKLKSTYVDSLPQLIHPRTGRVHTSYNQTGAATGRISSSDPNLQNIPVRTELGRLIRAAFIPAEGNLLISADYSQVELRVLAHLSGDEVLIDAFRRNQDIHARTAEAVFGDAAKANPLEYRTRAKAINFGIIYGLSAFGLGRQLGIGRNDAQAFIDAYFERHRGVRAWLDRTLEEARGLGMVRTYYGRRRPIPDIRSKDFNARNFAERAAVNSPIQGTAADIMKIAMVRVHEGFQKAGLSAKIILQVHDELVIEAPLSEVEEAKAVAREQMEGAADLEVPLVVDLKVADNWMEMK